MIFQISQVIKILILADLIFEAALGFLSPIFSIFIVQKIEGGNTLVAGISSAIYLIFFSLLRIPIAAYLDKKRGERDDFLCMFFGFLIGSLPPFGFIFSKYPWQVYLLQAIEGAAIAMAFSGYMSIFTRHIDRGKEATEWGIRASLIGLGSGLSAVIGGELALKFGFEVVFFLAGILSLLGCFFVWLLKNEFLKK